MANVSDAVESAERALHAAHAATVAMNPEVAVAELWTAVRCFTEAGDDRRAATACVMLGHLLTDMFGDRVAGLGCFARARRLVADLPACVEQGWVAVAPMGCDVGDAAGLVEHADFALSLGRRFSDVNLEAKALADGGLARVQLGRSAEGMEMLDEAMALVCGAVDDDEVAARSVCSFFTACYHSADFDRAEAWVPPLRRRGLLGSTTGPQLWLSSHCDSVRGYALFELGRWSEAEALLVGACERFAAGLGPEAVWHPAIALADLRIAQGRLAEAEQLLLGKDSAFQALLPLARLHLARGDHDLAAAAARRGLVLLGADRLRALELLAVAVAAALTRHDLEAAAVAASEICARTEGVTIAAVRARSAVPRAALAAAHGDFSSGLALLDEALAELGEGGAPWLRVQLACAAARIHEQAGERAAAEVAARAASALVSGLDVVLPAADADVLSRLAASASASASASPTIATLQRDGKWWDAAYAGRSVRLAHSKGLAYLADLIAHPGVERHVFDLVDLVDVVEPTDAPATRRALGNAGPMLDPSARRSYRARIEELRAVADDALAIGNDAAAERAQAEIESLVRELARAIGLGGRDRAATSAAERARLNVTRALRAASERIGAALPEAGPLIDRHLRTGTFCAYEPAPDDRIRWIVQC